MVVAAQQPHLPPGVDLELELISRRRVTMPALIATAAAAMTMRVRTTLISVVRRAAVVVRRAGGQGISLGVSGQTEIPPHPPDTQLIPLLRRGIRCIRCIRYLIHLIPYQVCIRCIRYLIHLIPYQVCIRCIRCIGYSELRTHRPSRTPLAAQVWGLESP